MNRSKISTYVALATIICFVGIDASDNQLQPILLVSGLVLAILAFLLSNEILRLKQDTYDQTVQQQKGMINELMNKIEKLEGLCLEHSRQMMTQSELLWSVQHKDMEQTTSRFVEKLTEIQRTLVQATESGQNNSREQAEVITNMATELVRVATTLKVWQSTYERVKEENAKELQSVKQGFDALSEILTELVGSKDALRERVVVLQEEMLKKLG